MKKHNFLLASICILLGVNIAAAQDAAITVDFYYPTSTDNPEAEIFQRYADDFNAANPGIEVVPIFAGGYDDITAAARNSILNDTPGPDVAVLLTVDLFDFIDNGFIVPAQDFIATMPDGDAYVEDFFRAFLENSVDGNGVVWTVPFQRSTPILYYNKDLFRAAGLNPEQPPRNRDELVDYALALTNEDTYGLYVPSAGFPYWLFQSFAIAHGQNVVGQSPTEVFFNSPEVVDALTFFMSLTEEHAVMPPGALSFFDAPGEFFDERAAMIYHTTGSLTNILQNASFEVGVGFLPSGPAGADGSGYGAPTGGGNLYIFSNITPEEQQAAWLWVEYITSPEIQADWTVNTGYIAARSSAWETDTLQDLVTRSPEYAVARDQLTFAGKELTAHDGIAVRAVLNDALASVIAGEASPQEALDAAQANADELLAPYRE